MAQWCPQWSGLFLLCHKRLPELQALHSQVWHRQEGSRKDGNKRAFFLCVLSFTEVGKSFPQSPNHLSLPSSWPKLDHMAIASCRGGCESKYLGFSVPIVGSWQGKSGLGVAMGSHPIVSCFGNFALMKWRPSFKILLSVHYREYYQDLVWGLFSKTQIHKQLAFIHSIFKYKVQYSTRYSSVDINERFIRSRFRHQLTSHCHQ